MRKKEHLLNNRIKRFIIKAQTDAKILNKSHNSFIGIYITFGHHMSRFLSLKPDQHILIAHLGVPPSEDSNMYLKLRPNLKKKKVERCFVYSDIVSPKIRFGDHLTNLLDIVSLNSNGMAKNLIRYKPLHHSKINQISVSVNDIDGNPIHFEEEGYTVFELNIRPVAL